MIRPARVSSARNRIADPGRAPGHQSRLPVKLHAPIVRRRTDIPADPGASAIAGSHF
jgi:hypothetical protein